MFFVTSCFSPLSIFVDVQFFVKNKIITLMRGPNEGL